jgi:hypothetical protein
MTWSEEGGPRVVPPTRMGFGHVIVGRMAEATLEGLVDASYAVTGFTWKLSAPLKNVST